jgi:hypothetical protein
MEIDDEIETRASQTPGEPRIIEWPARTTWSLGDDDVVQMRIVTDDGLGCGLDKVADMGLRKPSSHRSDRWCREHDIANQAQSNEKNLHPFLLASRLRSPLDFARGDPEPVEGCPRP